MKKIAFIIFISFSLIYAQKNRIVNGDLENIINEPYNLPCTGSQGVQAFNIEWNNAYGWKNFKGVSNLWGPLRDIGSCIHPCSHNDIEIGVHQHYLPTNPEPTNHYGSINLDNWHAVLGTLRNNIIQPRKLVRLTCDIAVIDLSHSPYACSTNTVVYHQRDGELFFTLFHDNNLPMNFNLNFQQCRALRNKIYSNSSITYNYNNIGRNTFTKVRFPITYINRDVKTFTIGGINYDECYHKEKDNGYVFIDNMELESYDMCSCNYSKATQPLIIGNIPNVFTPNYDGVNDYWRFSVDNMTDYDLEVYDRNGKLVYKVENQVPYDGPNINPFVVWNGIGNKGSVNGKIVVDGVYTYKVNVKNCNHNFTRMGSFTKLGNNPSPYPPPFSFDFVNWACCTPDYYLQNDFFESGITYEAAQTITAVNVTANANTVIFQAGNEIVLGDNFIAENGKEFIAFIAECVPGASINYGKNYSISDSKLLFYNNDDIISLETELSPKLNIMDSENGSFTFMFQAYAHHSPFFEEITLHTNYPCYVKIYDILGNELYHNYIQDNIKISTDFWSKGVYIIEFYHQKLHSIKQKIVKL